MLKQIEKATDILKNGGVIAFPTDTVYGLGANVFDEKAVGKIYEIKKRSKDKPIAVLVSSLEQVKKITTDTPKMFYELASEYWPGALTIILKANEKLPSIVTAGYNTVGVRMPDNPIALSLIRQFGNPIATTSANISGDTPAISAKQVREMLNEKLDFIIDGGETKIGIASTVVDLSSFPPVILRQGTVKLSLS